MKNYTITVNGNVYDVTVEEGNAAASQTAPVATPVAPVAPKAAPKAAPVAPAAPKAAPAGTQGGLKISAPMPGKILSIKANAGQAVKKGDVILVFEAMKMENEIVAPQDGTVASVNVAVGDQVEAGAVIATLN